MSIMAPYKGKFRISQIYKGTNHQGIDLVGVSSKDLYTTTNGTVEIASNADPNGFGIYVRIKSSDNGYIYYYGHMSSVCVKVGQKVKIGDKIGVEGSTGHSTGSHCHYEVRTRPGVKSSFTDINKISGIPNTVGTYTSDLFNTLNTIKDEENIIYRVQVGAFANRDNANKLLNSLKKAGFDGYLVPVNVNGQNLLRVQVGAFAIYENAVNLKTKLNKSGYPQAFILKGTR